MNDINCIAGKRYLTLDLLRGAAVVLMIIFHFFFDLTLFGHLRIDYRPYSFWYLLPRIIVTLFLLCVGMSLPITHLPQIKWKKFSYRLLKIAFWALMVSISTYFLFRSHWIYFGTLHCIVVGSLLALPFLRHPIISLTIGLALLFSSILFDSTLPWIVLPHKSLDYVSPFPWFGVILLGIFGNYLSVHKIFQQGYKILPKSLIRIISFLGFLGRHSLIIYILHQPLIYGTFYLIHNFKKFLE